MRVLVLGAYGLIGSEVVRRLRAAEIQVVGFGRDLTTGRRPDIEWRSGDLNALCDARDWTPLLLGIDAVVNASGALQDGAKDRLSASQGEAIRACVDACVTGKVSRFVQISAPGARADAETAFMRTKAHADDALRRSSLTWTILKPGLVISAYAYGGTAFIRMLAAFPFVQPLVLPDARAQTVAASDVAEAVILALTTERMVRADIDLVEPNAHALKDIVAAFRAWLGFPPARATIAAPRFVGRLVAYGADLAGWLGWRSPLRTTALSVLANNVLGDAAMSERALGRPLKSLREALEEIPATMQERTFARAHLVFPLMVLVLAGFWMASGLVALTHLEAAIAVLRGTALAGVAQPLVIGGALLDLAIGAGVCVRATARLSAFAAALASAGYLLMGTLVTPQIWGDPLGAFVKVIPGIALALAVAALAERR